MQAGLKEIYVSEEGHGDYHLGYGRGNTLEEVILDWVKQRQKSFDVIAAVVRKNNPRNMRHIGSMLDVYNMRYGDGELYVV